MNAYVRFATKCEGRIEIALESEAAIDVEGALDFY
jgi:hypothetical protein